MGLTRTATADGNPNFIDIFEVGGLAGITGFEWGNMTSYDTTNSIYYYKTGGRNASSFLQFMGNRPTSGIVNRLLTLFDFNNNIAGNGAAGANVLGVRAGSDSLFSVKKNGSIELDKYGIGNKKASNGGFNKPTHLAAFTPTGTGQGTIVDYPLDSIPTNSIYNNLPNGNVSIDADGNNLEINNLYELNLASSSGETYLAFYDDDSFEIRSDQEIDIGHSLGGRTRWGQNGIIMSAWSSVPRVYYNQVYLDSVAFKVTTTHPTPGTTENVFNVALENGSNEGLVTLGKYTSAAPFTALTVGEDATDLFLTTTSTTGKVIGKAMRQITNVKDADLTITDNMLDLSMDIHVWAYCSNAASDSVVIDLPTPGTDYLGQIVSVYGDGRNATLNRDVYVRCVGAKLWHGNASPTGETYYQVTSLTGAIDSRTAEFICVQNPDDSLYYWQLKQHP